MMEQLKTGGIQFHSNKKVKTIGKYKVLSGWHRKSKMVNRVVDRLRRAAIYFSPDSAQYFKNLKTYVINSTDVNAFAAPGGIVVVYEGLVDKYLNEEMKGECNAEIVRYY